MNNLTKAFTAYHLGVGNIARVVKYRLSLKLGLSPLTKLDEELPIGQFFSEGNLDSLNIKDLPESIKLNAFGYLPYVLSTNNIPNWFYNVLTGNKFDYTETVWHKIPDFDDQVGDIKGIWEASRFDWVIKFVEAELRQTDNVNLPLLDLWINDWVKKNPGYLGPNWKCGQEASIRVMHLIAGAVALDRINNLNNNLLKLIEAHLKRIAPTIDYAIAQDNNHGTSEATALYIGGAVLNHNKPNPQFLKWQLLGEKWLINRANKLIMKDGGFSQYSVNYHRVMLDSYCLAEIVRRQLHLNDFPKRTYRKLVKATDWLYVMSQDNGDAPNLGANDGANLLPIGDCDYRDYRPSVQLASTLFNKQSYYQKNGSYDAILDFFQVSKTISASKLPSKSQIFKSSGLVTHEFGQFFIAFKLPIFKFRPSQCDALHLDVWHGGHNILRDGGTYSYNTTENDLDYFSGIKSHNTIEFDSHLQMPRISRFLFGAWLTPLNLKYKKNKFSCGYKDYWDCKHTRTVETSPTEIKVIDQVTGFQNQAILRWRLMPGNWDLNGHIISNTKFSLEIRSESNITIQLTEGYESKYYYRKTTLPVLEIKTDKPTTITTLIKDLS